MRGERGLVRLSIVSVVVRFSVDRVFIAVSVGLVTLVSFVVAVRVVDVLD